MDSAVRGRGSMSQRGHQHDCYRAQNFISATENFGCHSDISNKFLPVFEANGETRSFPKYCLCHFYKETKRSQILRILLCKMFLIGLQFAARERLNSLVWNSGKSNFGPTWW